MSEIVLPNGVNVPNEEIPPEQRSAKQLPNPVGYKMLVAIPESSKEYESGLVKADKTIRDEEVATIVGFVLKLGPDCYKNKELYPSGPWCKEGDFVLFKPYSGTRIKIHGQEFRILNEDAIEGTTEDPRGYSRAY